MKIVVTYIVYWVVYSIIFTVLYMLISSLYYSYISWGKLSSGIMQESAIEHLFRLAENYLLGYILFAISLLPLVLILPFTIWLIKNSRASLTKITIDIGAQIAAFIAVSIFYFYLSQEPILGLEKLLRYRYFVILAIGAISALLTTRIVLIPTIKTFSE